MIQRTSVVVPIDKLSVVVSIMFSYFVFKEKLTKKALLGLMLMVVATILMAIFLKVTDSFEQYVSIA